MCKKYSQSRFSALEHVYRVHLQLDTVVAGVSGADVFEQTEQFLKRSQSVRKDVIMRMTNKTNFHFFIQNIGMTIVMEKSKEEIIVGNTL